MIAVTTYYTTCFGELWEKSFSDLIREALEGILAQSKLDKKEISAIFFGNMLGGIVENNLHTGANIAEILDLHIPIFRTEAACASGGVAFHLGYQYLQSNPGKTIIVIGAEKMNDASPEKITTALSSAASQEEQEVGLTFPGLYGMLAQYYLHTYHYTEKHLAAIPVKNHYHATLNEKAHFKRAITIEQVLASPYVATPLKVLDSSPISDGAAAVILTNDPKVIKKARAYASILASEVATDSISLMNRKRLDTLEATTVASGKAFAHARLKPQAIQIAELHDCFSIAEILAMEDIGFWKKGSGGRRATEFSTQFGSGGPLITNTSGGLKAAGHPVGATGIKQIGEVYLQLTQQAGKRQVKSAQYGLAHNVGGSGGTAVISVLGV